jgi:hypothetical protein
MREIRTAWLYELREDIVDATWAAVPLEAGIADATRCGRKHIQVAADAVEALYKNPLRGFAVDEPIHRPAMCPATNSASSPTTDSVAHRCFVSQGSPRRRDPVTR